MGVGEKMMAIQGGLDPISQLTKFLGKSVIFAIFSKIAKEW